MLVVDDEPLMVAMMARILAPEHQVKTAHSGYAAWQWLEEGERFDLMVCDLSMPGLDGLGLLELVEQSDPELARRTLFVTGGPASAAARRFVLECPERCLAKPFGAHELRERVAMCLNLKG